MTSDEINLLFTGIGETLAMTLLSTLCAYIIGVPLGIILNVTSKKGIKPNRIINLILGTFVNVFRSIPALIIIVICIPWSRAWLGKGTGEWYTIIIPLTVSSFGFCARMVEQSLSEVPGGELEAVKSLGASNWQLITKVLIPEARSSLIGGLAVSIVSIIGYTAFAYNIGAHGVISNIYSFYKNNTKTFLESPYFWVMIVAIVIIVQIVQELGLYIAKRIDKRRYLK